MRISDWSSDVCSSDRYVLRLAIMLPLICAMIVGGLWIAKRFNLGGMNARAGNSRSVARLPETVFLSPGVKLAVVDFADKRLLLAVTKQGAKIGRASCRDRRCQYV